MGFPDSQCATNFEAATFLFEKTMRICTMAAYSTWYHWSLFLGKSEASKWKTVIYKKSWPPLTLSGWTA